MRKLILVVALLSTGALAQTDILGTVRKYSVSESSTQAAPTLVTQGLPLKDVSAVQLLVCAPWEVLHADGGVYADETLADGGTSIGTGARARQFIDGGSMLAYYWDNDIASFLRKSDLDESLDTANTTGCQQFSARGVGLSSGRLYYAASGVVRLNRDAGPEDDGGTQLTVQLKGWTGGVPGRAEKQRVHGAVTVSGTTIPTGPDGGAVATSTAIGTSLTEVEVCVDATFAAGALYDGGLGVYSAYTNPAGMKAYEICNTSTATSTSHTCGTNTPVIGKMGKMLPYRVGASGTPNCDAVDITATACPRFYFLASAAQTSGSDGGTGCMRLRIGQ